MMNKGAEGAQMRLFKFISLAIAVVCYTLIVVCTGSPVYAEEDASAASVSTERPQLAPMMSALDKIGLADPLRKMGINIYGYVEAGWFYDATSPRKGSGPTFIGYNISKVTSPLIRSV